MAISIAGMLAVGRCHGDAGSPPKPGMDATVWTSSKLARISTACSESSRDDRTQHRDRSQCCNGFLVGHLQRDCCGDDVGLLDDNNCASEYDTLITAMS